MNNLNETFTILQLFSHAFRYQLVMLWH